MGPKSVVQAMGAVSLCRSTIANASHCHFQGCKALLRIVKRRYIKYCAVAFFNDANCVKHGMTTEHKTDRLSEARPGAAVARLSSEDVQTGNKRMV